MTRTLRLGLCCGFAEAPIKYRTTTARYAGGLAAAARRAFLLEIVTHNAAALGASVDWCIAHGVGAFRVNSDLLPLATHASLGYELADLDTGGRATALLDGAGRRARRGGVRLSFHPDQFVVPGSIRDEVVRSSLGELEAQTRLALVVGAEQITIHGGGAQGGKPAALERLARALARLSAPARERVVLENDDRVYTVEDLLPICRREGLALVYDVHHHRCNPDELSVEDATDACASTWGRREPWAHISSPIGGWTKARDPRPHADHIAASDLPRAWRGRRMTVDVEAKAKELAVLRLARHLG